jgi:ornithine cyclodeaminase/alanine dehydrogenase
MIHFCLYQGSLCLSLFMLILSEQDLRSLLRLGEVVGAVEEGFRALGRGDVRAPERLHLDIPESRAVMLEMPAYARSLSTLGGSLGDTGRSALGTKIVSVFNKNAERNLDSVQSVYVLLHGETGVPLAIMEGRFITGIRTAATSALATRHMAPPGPKRLGVFGAGVQARFHIDAMIEIAEVESILIASRGQEKAHALADYVRSFYSMDCEVVGAERAVTQSNLICTCTNAGTPLFDGALLQEGSHINAVGSFTPTTRELDTEAVRRARTIIDADWAAGREAGEILIPVSEGAIAADHVRGSLDQVVSGEVAGRESSDEITLFKSSGLAVEDLVTAQLAFDRARAEGVGTEAPLGK